MRSLYIIRHGEPEFNGEKRCIGHTDIPLSERGKGQAGALSVFFDHRELTAVFTSPAKRACQTAELLSRGRWPLAVCEPLVELYMGEWEGLTFSEIRCRFSDLYEQRGKNPEITPPQGEPLAAGQRRAAGAIQQILSKTTGDIAVVAHAGINRLLMCKYNDIPLNEWMTVPQPYGCINTLCNEGNDFASNEIGRMPQDAPDEAECLNLLWKRQTPLPVIDHCWAVAYKADEIAMSLTRRGFPIDRNIVHAGALLHDIARALPLHAQAGASWLIAEGYPRVAKVIAEHEELPEPVCGAPLDESAVVCFADKLILETNEVTLEERFARSLEKCRNEEARHAHEKRFRQALELRERIFSSGEHT
ncbi:MAG: histidine phosphatase family protein [Treponema sp.]|jgi:broad specificity phosphatase PhoE/5'-deoxynucleotidase YfbR-like HD superfamily hydrolase|nr:histidine phosphatase family protein [Treponema sp.]